MKDVRPLVNLRNALERMRRPSVGAGFVVAAARAALLAATCFAAQPAMAQLAITEVMSAAAFGSFTVPQDPPLPPLVHHPYDFWELTNFGTNIIFLDQYSFSDPSGKSTHKVFLRESIGPNESIILARTVPPLMTNAAQFRAWWGENRIPSNLQIFFYPNDLGLSSLGEGLNVWKNQPDGTRTIIDHVRFEAGTSGLSFTYDTNDGAFGVLSQPGIHGAVVSALGGDTASPGVTTGPVPLSVTQPPTSLVTTAGWPATLSVAARGLPRPRFQWLHDGLPIPAATAATLVLPEVSPADAGQYVVTLDNGFESFTSPAATVTVQTNWQCVTILRPPTNITVTPGQPATFSVGAPGNPPPTYQWEYNGRDIPGATTAAWTVTPAQFTDAGRYTVRVSNAFCFKSASAQLAVVPAPNLIVTEVMANQSTNQTAAPRGDWWELTNMDTNAVALRGYRFNDTPTILATAFSITNDVTVQPGESIILVEDLSADEFVSWWGAENLPEQLQVITYTGHGLSAVSDGLALWNATAVGDGDVITAVGFATSAPGISLRLDPDFAPVGEKSVVGLWGAFRAAKGGDIGSPGWTTNPPPRVLRPRLAVMQTGAGTVTLGWNAQAGITYDVQYRASLAGTNWTSLRRAAASASVESLVDTLPSGERQRFYRILAAHP